VDDARVLAILEAADYNGSIPRLGGMARPQGVFIGAESHWAFAGVSGSLSEGRSGTRLRVLSGIPVLRGLLRLGMALAPALARRQEGGRERPVFLLALLVPIAFVFLPPLVSLILGLVTTVAFLLWLFRGRTLHLHGAEHRAIAAAETRTLVATWNGEARPSRFALRCGTNFAVCVLPCTYALQTWWPFQAAWYTPLLLALLALGLGMELWKAVHAGPARLARVLLLPGLTLQRLTTREPTLEETRVALRAVAAVLTAAAAEPVAEAPVFVPA
jgi:uncharacterized protein YqhQ